MWARFTRRLPGVFQADVRQPSILGFPAVEGYPLHPAAIGPFQAVAEQVSLHLPALAAKVRRRHAFDPKRQRMVTQLLGQHRVQHRFAIERPPGDFLLGLLSDFLDELVDILLE
jgi:hypothetical protein